MKWLKLWFEQPAKAFNGFLTGAGLFFTGLALLLIAETKLYESVIRDLLALIALTWVVSGILIAVIGYVAMNFARWRTFFQRPVKSNKKD